MWRLVLVLIACKGDAPPSQPPQPTPRLELVSSTPPALVAVRTDDGAWTSLALRDDGYDLPAAPRFTLVVVCAHWLGADIEVREWTARDDLDFAVGCVGFDGEPLAEVHAKFAPGDVVQTVTTGGIHELCSSNVEACRLRTGTHDAIVLHGATHARIHRDLRIFDGAQIDANALGGWEPERRTVEIVSGERRNKNSVYVCLETRHGDELLCSGQTYWREFPDRIEQEYVRVPDAARVATDCDVLEVQGTRMCLRDAPRTHVDIAERAVPPMQYDRAAHALAFSLADADALEIVVRSREPKAARWSIVATRGALGTATTYTLPELSTIPGWRPEWARGDIIDGALIWGPKPSSSHSRPRLWQRLRPGDRMDAAAASVEHGGD